MQIKLKFFQCTLQAIISVFLMLGAAQAQQDPLTIVVGFPAGGSIDMQARALASALQEQTGRTVVVVNKPGAAGAIAAESFANASPDGNTVLLHGTYFQSATAASLEPLLQISETAIGIWAKGNRRGGNLAFSGDQASYSFLSANKAALSQWMGGTFTPIPYRGIAPAITDTAAGNADYMMGGLAAMTPASQAGLTLVAISSRSVAESLGQAALGRAIPNMRELTLPLGLFVPPGTPQAAKSRLSIAMTNAVNSPNFASQSRLAEMQIVKAVRSADSLAVQMNSYADVAQIAVNNGAADNIPAPVRMAGISASTSNIASNSSVNRTSQATSQPTTTSNQTSPSRSGNITAECTQEDNRLSSKMVEDSKLAASKGDMTAMLRIQLMRWINSRNLYSDRCSGADNAKSRREQAQNFINGWQNYCQQWGMGSQCAAPPVLAANKSTSTASSNSQGESSSNATGKQSIERVDRCIDIQNTHVQGNDAQWYRVTNTCSSAIKFYSANNSERYGNLKNLAPGQTDTSWWSLRTKSSLPWVACPEKSPNGKDVRLDEANANSLACFYYN